MTIKPVKFVTSNIVTYNEDTPDDDLNDAVNLIIAADGIVTGAALSPVLSAALSLRKACFAIWLYYCRLEEGYYQWPDKYDGKTNPAIIRQQLSWIPDGLNLCEPDTVVISKCGWVKIRHEALYQSGQI